MLYIKQQNRSSFSFTKLFCKLKTEIKKKHIFICTEKAKHKDSFRPYRKISFTKQIHMLMYKLMFLLLQVKQGFFSILNFSSNTHLDGLSGC